MTMKIYLAGPDVFRKDASAFFEDAALICSKRGFQAICPVDGHEKNPRTLFLRNHELIRKSDIVLANLEPFRGVEPDSGTVWELGFAFAIGKPCFGYRTVPGSTVNQVEHFYPPVFRQGNVVLDRNEMLIENFGLPSNLMIFHSLSGLFFGSLDTALAGIQRS